MLIAGKSDFSYIKLKDRKEKGFDYIELFTENDILRFNNKDINKYRTMLQTYNITICSIHTPHYIINNKTRHICSIGAKGISERSIILNTVTQTIEFANLLIPSNNKHRYVVVHPSTSVILRDILRMPTHYTDKDRARKINSIKSEMLARIEEDLKVLVPIAERSNITICLENMPLVHPFEWGTEYAQVYLACRFPNDLNQIIYNINSKNLKVAVDIAHLVTIRNSFSQEYESLQKSFLITEEELKFNNYSLVDYIQEYQTIIGLIHLNYAEGIGEIYSKHGISWPKDNQKELEQIISSLYNFNFSGPTVIEINETNLDNAVGSLKTLLLVKESINNIQ